MAIRFCYLFLATLLGSALFAEALPSPTGFSFAKGAKFTVAGYTNATGTARSTTLEKFPVLVRLQANSPVGFSYADLQHTATGADLCFVDMDGTGLPFEIDTWDASGESLIWVRLPSMTNGTEFVMCWGGGTSGKTVCDESPFSNYVGVWHMSEASGTVADSSGNGFAATPSGPASETACVAVAGPVGNGRQCSTALGAANLSYLSVPSYDSKSVGDTFAVSGWVSIGSGQTGNDNDARFFSRKENYQNTHGWEVLWKTTGEIRVRGAASGDNIKLTGDNYKYAGQGWKHVFIVYDGKNSVFYENGVQKGSKTGGTAATENGRPLAIGGYANDNGSQLLGSVDECRLLDAVPSADWVKAEYDSMNDAAFLTAGEAESYGELVDLMAGLSVSDVSYTNATIGVSIGSLGSGAESANVLVQLAATSDFASPVWSTTYSVIEAGLRTFSVAELETNTTYFARVLVTNSLDDAVSSGPVLFTTLSPGAPMATASVSGRTSSSISAAVSVTTIGAGSDACTARLEASTDGFATVAAFAETALASPGSMAMEVSGLSPFTVYALRLCVTNAWGLAALVDLGMATTLPESGLAELYVDSLGSGNGSSPESALPTIRAALDIAGPNFTIWVRGGEGRAYGVTNEMDTLPIPATLEGLSIRAYDETPGDGGRALVQISDTYIDDGHRAHIVSNGAENVTLSGLDFTFGARSVGRQDVGSCSVVWTRAPFTTLENCLLRMPEPTVYAGSGAASPLVICTAREATNLVVRGCEFRNTRCWSAAHGYAPIKCKSNAVIVGNIFTNVNATATAQQADLVNGGEQACYNFSFVSNVVYGANDGGNLSYGLLFGLYPGPKSAEIAFNRFVADPNARNMQGGIIPHRVNLAFGAQFAEAFPGYEATLIHNNTIIGGRSAFLFNDAQNNKRKNQFFNNLILLDQGGTNLVENVSTNATEFAGGRTTSFISPSCLRNNAYTGVLTGGSATRLATYDLEKGLEITNNIVISASLEFICTNDIYSADFYRVRCHPGDPNLKRLGWRGPDDLQPRFIGALEPVVPGSFTIHLR